MGLVIKRNSQIKQAKILKNELNCDIFKKKQMSKEQVPNIQNQVSQIGYSKLLISFENHRQTS